MELYHYNRNHDPKTGRFASSHFSGNRIRSFLNRKKIKQEEEEKARKLQERQKRKADIAYLEKLGDQEKIELYKKIKGDPWDDEAIGKHYGLKSQLDELRTVKKEYVSALNDYSDKIHEFYNSKYGKDEKATKTIDAHLGKAPYDDPELTDIIKSELPLKDGIKMAFGGSMMGGDFTRMYVYENYPEISSKFFDTFSEYRSKREAVAKKAIQEKGRAIFDLRVDLLNRKRIDEGWQKSAKYEDDVTGSLEMTIDRLLDERRL